MIFKVALLAALLSASAAAHAAITVVDDAGRTVTVAAPARRVIAMAPHIAELLFAAGGGSQVVGAMNYSDYPPEAKRVPLVGSDAQVDIERVIALKPDLIVVWQSGNTARQLEQLAALGVPLFFSEPRRLDEVATSLTRLGALLGHAREGDAAAASYRASIAALRARYATRAPVRVFYQIWDKPLYTLSAGHVVSDVIALCGGQNVFGALRTVAPSVSTEAVLQANPEAVFGSEQQSPDDRGIGIWQPYRQLLAVQRGNLFRVPGVLLTRPGPRLALGAAALCEDLETARRRRPGYKALQP